MSFEWGFNVAEFPSGRVSPIRKCYRGPMIPVEIVMSQPFRVHRAVNDLRHFTLKFIVDTENMAVKTREVVLRTLNGSTGSLHALYPEKALLQATICEKRLCTDIDRDLAEYTPEFIEAARDLFKFGVGIEAVQIFFAALESTHPAVRVEAKCGIILAYSELELAQQND
jgi:hypothetical protein